MRHKLGTMSGRTSPMIKAIVFDLFSTLTSLSHTPGAPGQNTHEILGVDHTVWKEALFNDSRERLIGAITEPVEIIKDIVWKIDPSIPVEILHEVAAKRKVRFKYCLENPPKGVIESLRQLKNAGYPLALISNADVTEVAAWHGSELGSLFDIAIFSCHEGTMKPESKIFQICLEQLDLTGKECLYVGDGGNDELIASAKEGMTAVLTTQFLKTTWPEKIEERRKTVNYEIDNINEILALLDRIEEKNR